MLIVCLVVVRIVALIGLVLKLFHVNVIDVITVLSKIVEIHLGVTIKVIDYFESIPIALPLRHLGGTTDCWYFGGGLLQELLIELWILALLVLNKFLLVLLNGSVWKEPFEEVHSLIGLDYLLCNGLVRIFSDFLVLAGHIILFLHRSFLLVDHIFKNVVGASLKLFILYDTA